MLTELKRELKELVIRECGLLDLKPDTFADDAVMFGGGEVFGLDSVDYLQLCMALCASYGIKIKLTDYRVTFQTVLKDINTMADYISKHRGEVKVL